MLIWWLFFFALVYLMYDDEDENPSGEISDESIALFEAET